VTNRDHHASPAGYRPGTWIHLHQGDDKGYIQVMLFYEYIHKVRPELLKTETDRLVVTLRGIPESCEGITYLVETFKPLFHSWNLNPRTIRQSGLEELQAAIEKHHPSG